MFILDRSPNEFRRAIKLAEYITNGLISEDSLIDKWEQEYFRRRVGEAGMLYIAGTKIIRWINPHTAIMEYFLAF